MIDAAECRLYSEFFTVPILFPETKFFLNRLWYFFSGPFFSSTGSGKKWKIPGNSLVPVPNSRESSDTGTFFQDTNFLVLVLFLGPIFSSTDTRTTQKVENSWEFFGNGTKFPGMFRYQYQIFPVPIPVLFFGTKLFRYRYQCCHGKGAKKIQ